MKKTLLILLRFGIPLAIIAGLIITIDRRQFAELDQRNLDWRLLSGAFAMALLAVIVSFHRWYFLVKALGIPFRVRDAFRLGFLGYLFSFISVGVVGGDLFKAIFIAREQPGRRTLAVASVLVDRVIGVYALLLVTTSAMLFTPLPSDAGSEVFILRNVTYAATVIGGLGLLLLANPHLTSGRLALWAISLPKIGATMERLIHALHCYRNQPWILLIITVQSLAVHWLITVAVHLLAQGLFPITPTFGEQLIIVPLSNLAAALPFTPAGLGTMELAMETLYRIIPARARIPGIVVALAFRVITIIIAAVGIAVYWFSRREVRAVLREQQ